MRALGMVKTIGDNLVAILYQGDSSFSTFNFSIVYFENWK